jgi:choline dehydrogenase-like flavoprotein
MLTRGGPLAQGSCEVGAFVRASERSERIDTQILFMPISMGPSAPGSSRITVEREPGFMVIAYQLRPRSRGRIEIQSPDPSAMPKIMANYLAEPEDREAAIAATRFVRRFMATRPIADVVDHEIGPLADAGSDSEIIDRWLRFGGPGCHAAGTCRMGTDELAVVDGRGRVRGVQGLRVVDNSIMPFITAGNTAAPVMAVAMRVGDLIADDHRNDGSPLPAFSTVAPEPRPSTDGGKVRD